MSERNGWDRAEERWERSARKGPWSLFAKIVVTVLIVSAIFGAIGFVCSGVRETAQVAHEEFGPRALLKKYEWFKDVAASCDKKMADIRLYKGKIEAMRKDYEGVSRADWSRVDSQNLSQWQAELDGIKASYNDLTSRYNAQMSKENWRFTEVGRLPDGASEPLPREFKPYLEE